MSVTRSNECLMPPGGNNEDPPLGGGKGGGSNRSVNSTRTHRHENFNEPLPVDIQRRVDNQFERFDALETLFNEHELNEPGMVYGEVMDSIKESERLHEAFLKEHTSLVLLWPAAHSDHAYFRHEPSKNERITYNKLRRLLRRQEKRLRPPVQQTVAAQTAPAASVLPQRSKLPEIKLPKFDGDYRKWSAFKSIFENEVLNRPNTEVAKTSKLHYLQLAVANSPANIIGHIQPTAGCMGVAWSMIKERFQNKRLVAHSYFERLFSLPKLRTRSSSGMHNMHATITETLEGLKLAEVKDPADCILVYHCTKLLDSDTRERWESSLTNANEIPKLSQLLEFLSTRARTLEGIENSTPSNTNIQSQSTTRTSPTRRAHGLTASKGNDTRPFSNVHSPTTWLCDACPGQHYIGDCERYNDVDFKRKLKIVKDKKLCYKCLLRHNAKNCMQRNRCSVQGCNQPHHSSLHGIDLRKFFGTNQNENSSAQRSGATANQRAQQNPPEQPQAEHIEYSIKVHEEHTKSPEEHIQKPILEHTKKPTIEHISRLNSEHTNEQVEHRAFHAQGHTVLLATAQAKIKTDTQEHKVRLLIDTGSELSFITETLVYNLQLTRSRAAIEIHGIGGKSATKTRGKVTVTLQSRFRRDKLTVEAYILPTISSVIPSSDIEFHHNTWTHLDGLKLADPHFNRAQSIDLILGADCYRQLIKPNIIKQSESSPIAQLSVFGWLILGPATSSSARPRTPCAKSIIFSQDLEQSTTVSPKEVNTSRCFQARSIISNEELDELLKQFWEQGETPIEHSSTLSHEEQECEHHFKSTHTRDFNGRYVVRIPLKNPVSSLGNSYLTAHRCLQRTIRRLDRDPEYKKLYEQFMNEYEQLEHMQSIPTKNVNNQEHYYLPHHGVLREQSTTTKLRVVFNGSSATSSGKSINDIMHPGPNLLLNIVDVLTWIRSFKHLFSTDITKMFRQIKVHEEDWDLQRILWVNEQEHEQHFHLTTVTYGTKAAPYLAVRTLIQLAEDEGKNYPLAVPSILKGRYVDDIFGGGDTPEEAQEIAEQLRALCKAGGFPPAKWHSTHQEDGTQNTTSDTKLIQFDNCDTKILGINWSPERDTFTFSSMVEMKEHKCTKRLILSQIATIFDPLGFASPVIVRAKILMQELWLLKVGWDDGLPNPVVHKWYKIREELTSLTRLSIPRWFNTSKGTIVELHGFSDASKLAMSAVIYLTVHTPSTGAQSTFICSKTKVAPLKKITIPRLELTAALLLAKLTEHFRTQLQFKIENIYLWTDSRVTLDWIRSTPSRWKEFVCNRVTQIQQLTEHANWRHVPGTQNPADCASRGITTEQLAESKLWWERPPWLLQSESTWPDKVPKGEVSCPEEERPGLTFVATTRAPTFASKYIERYSSVVKLLKHTSIILKLRSILMKRPISTHEALEQARKFWIKTTQSEHMGHDTRSLQESKVLPKTNPLSKLTAFIDAEGILRVGGRLEHALLAFDNKHPAILPRTSRFTELIIDQAHQRTLHGGTQLTLGHIRQQYWIIGGRASVKAHILKCVECARQRGIRAYQQMGQLPLSRVTPSRAFAHTGIDYAGPLTLKTWKGRGAKHSRVGFVPLSV